MLGNIISDYVDKNIGNMNIFRHFKGGYYVVHNLAKVESTGEEVVVYQSLQDGKVWTRPMSSFLEEVPTDKPNPTGQKHRFERVMKFDNQLSLIPTEDLLKELLSRADCPTELQTLNPEKVWRTDYLVGRLIDIFIDEDNIVEDFDVDIPCNTLEEAKGRIERKNDGNMTILKRVYVKQDFDL